MPAPEVRYCTTEDGVRIAYCVEGEGPAVIAVPGSISSFVEAHNLPFDAEFLAAIGTGRTLVQFDHRGVGLSQRDVPRPSLEALAQDVGAVSGALEFDQVCLLAVTIAGPSALAYAALKANKVSHLVLYETYANLCDIMTAEQVTSFAQLCRTNWHVAAQAFADMSAREEYPELTLQVAKRLEEGTTGEHTARLIEMGRDSDVSIFFPLIRAQTLVIHRRGDAVIPFSAAQRMAASIPGARLVPLEGSLTYPTLGDMDPVVCAIDEFLPKSERRASGPSAVDAQDRPHSTMAAPAVAPQSFASGRYVVQRLLGEGGQKTVFLARDTQLDRDVAVALLKPEGIDDAGLARLTREARALARLEAQPHIVAIYDIGEHPSTSSGQASRPYTVCEYLAGGSLEEELARAGGPLPVERAVAIARDVCRALIVAHGSDIIHRDIKPSNIWLTAKGSAKLGDFGLATALGRSQLTQTGMVMGTAAYMAPEQALGKEADQRSDIYALGCVLYEMLAGRPPFTGDGTVAVVYQHVEAAPAALSELQPGLPPALEAIVLKMLAKAPEDRPQTAAEVLAALG